MRLPLAALMNGLETKTVKFFAASETHSHEAGVVT